jgi:hypothetical protein
MTVMVMVKSILTSAICASCSFYSYIPHFPSSISISFLHYLSLYIIIIGSSLKEQLTGGVSLEAAQGAMGQNSPTAPSQGVNDQGGDGVSLVSSPSFFGPGAVTGRSALSLVDGEASEGNSIVSESPSVTLPATGHGVQIPGSAEDPHLDETLLFDGGQGRVRTGTASAGQSRVGTAATPGSGSVRSGSALLDFFGDSRELLFEADGQPVEGSFVTLDLEASGGSMEYGGNEATSSHEGADDTLSMMSSELPQVRASHHQYSCVPVTSAAYLHPVTNLSISSLHSHSLIVCVHCAASIFQ